MNIIGPVLRRLRLKELMVERGETNGMPTILRGVNIEEEQEIQQEAFVTEGTETLKEARIRIARFSLAR